MFRTGMTLAHRSRHGGGRFQRHHLRCDRFTSGDVGGKEPVPTCARKFLLTREINAFILAPTCC
jgi:hypothetical protein